MKSPPFLLVYTRYEKMQGISVIFDDINMALPNEKDRLHNLKIVDNMLINYLYYCNDYING